MRNHFKRFHALLVSFGLLTLVSLPVLAHAAISSATPICNDGGNPSCSNGDNAFCNGTVALCDNGSIPECMDGSPAECPTPAPTPATNTNTAVKSNTNSAAPTPTTTATPKTSGTSSSSGSSADTQLKAPFSTPTQSTTPIFAVIIQALLGVVGAGALLMFIWGGFILIFSGGVEDKIKTGRDTLLWATIGLLVILSSYAVLKYVFAVFSTAANQGK